jgi:hypothetical protein
MRKIIRKIEIILLFLLLTILGYSQAPCGNYLDWDWTKRESFDYAYIQGVGRINISSPFHTEGSASFDISNIIAAKDYFPNQGWVLLDKNFGCSSQYSETNYPYFMLYNKYRGIIRLFVFNNSGLQHQQAVATLAWDGSNRTSLLTLNNIKAWASDKYYPTVLKDDKALNYVQDYYNSSWFVTDYYVLFDHNTDPNKLYNLEFKIFSDITSDLNITGKFSFSTKSASVAGTAPDKNIPENKTYNLLKNGQKYLGKVPTEADMKKHFDNINSSLDTINWSICKNLGRELESANKALQDGTLKKILMGAATVSSKLNGVVGVVLKVFDFFISKPNSSATSATQLQPTVSNGVIDLKGTITTKVNASRFSLQLPGSNHKYSDGTSNYDGLPVYDCPLGVFGLENTPKLKMRNVDVIDYTQCYQNGLQDEYCIDYYRTDKSIVFDDDIRLAINSASKVKFLYGTAQLVYVGTMSKKYPMYEIFNRMKGPCFENMSEGFYEILNIDSSGIKISTSPLEISKFKGTAISYFPAFDKNELFLKLNLIFKPTEASADTTPIVTSIMYNLDIENQGYNPDYYPLTHAQLSKIKEINAKDFASTFLSGGILQTKGIIDIYGSNILLNGYESIIFKPGFKFRPSTNKNLKAQIIPIVRPNGSNSLVLSEYFQNCNCYPNTFKSLKSEKVVWNEEEDIMQPNLKLFPNPSNEILNIQVGNCTYPATLSIYDFNGKLVFSTIMNGYDYKLDISDYQNGNYIIKINTADKLITDKFVKY